MMVEVVTILISQRHLQYLSTVLIFLIGFLFTPLNIIAPITGQGVTNDIKNYRKITITYKPEPQRHYFLEFTVTHIMIVIDIICYETYSRKW